MIYKNIHIIFLIFLFSVALQGQKTTILGPVVIEGNLYKIQVTIVENEHLFSFSGSDIICLPSASGQILGLVFEIAGDPKLSIKLPYLISSKGEITNKFGNENGLYNTKFRRNFEVQNISNSSNSHIQFTLNNVDETLLKYFSINLSVAQPATADDCNSISNKQEKLNCLNQLTSRTPAQNNEQQNLTNQRNEAQRDLNKFQLSSTKTNVYRIACSNCNTADFKTSYNPKSVESSTSPWQTISITRNAKATVSHKDWSIEKTFDLIYKKKEATDAAKADNDNPPKEETQQGQSTEEEDASAIQSDVETTDTLPTTHSNIAQDTFWQDSISPLLNITNVFKKDPELFRRLRAYNLNSSAKPAKKILATALPYALPISIGLLVMLFLVILRQHRKSQRIPLSVENNQTEAIKPETKPKSDHVKKTPHPTKATDATLTATPEASPEEEGEISFDEVSTDDAIVAPPLDVIKSQSDYIPIDLLPCWRDTNVEQLFIHKACIRDLGLQIEQENTSFEASKNEEELSEIGGFLLGYIYQQDDRYDLAVSTFVPITPESNDRYAVKFGDQAWAQLDDAYHLYPGQRLIGWFHTHPGHGLFLSKADLDLHESTFQRPYQFAMEIDPLTTDYDIAFFTRQPNGTLNNMKDRRISHWWSFKALEKKAKIL